MVAGLFLSGCATHQGYVSEPLRLIKQGQVQEALAKLEPLAEKESKDQLVFLMEYGMALHIAGQYQESNKIFLKADKMTEDVDYYSVSRITTATLTGEEALQYKGESYEKLLINSYLALNYLMLGKFDDALVEVRRINDKVKKFRADGREDYELNSFSTYLAALLWEADQKYDDAYISFEKSYQLDKNNPLIEQDLIRSAKLSRRMEMYKKWKSSFPNVKEDPDWYDKKKGQVVVIFEQGWGPRKIFSPHDRRLPKLIPEYSLTQAARLKVEPGNKEATSQVVYDVEQAAIRTLDADYRYLIARKVAATVAKEVVADQIRQKDELLGLVARVAMYVADRADLRQWASLPQTIQVARLSLPPGEYKLSLQGLTGSGNSSTSDSLDAKTIKIVAGRKVFVDWRALH